MKGVLKSFIESEGAITEFQACETAVAWNIGEYGRNQFPVQVEDIVNWLGIRLNPVSSSALDGCLSWDSEGNATIFVSDRVSERRRRFTIAHELGHWIIQKSLGLEKPSRPLFRGVATNDFDIDEEEHLADSLAAEILMPCDEVREYCDVSEITLRTIRGLSKQFDVSRQAALRRIADVYDTSLIYLNVVPRRFRRMKSVIDVDDAIYVEPGARLIFDRGQTRLVGNTAFADVWKHDSFTCELEGIKGRLKVRFDVSSSSKPVPNVDLFSLECIPLCQQSERFLNSTRDDDSVRRRS